MACFVLVGPPLAACLLRRSTRHVASDGPTSNKTEMRPNRDAPLHTRDKSGRDRSLLFADNDGFANINMALSLFGSDGLDID